jgi:hypothetical protein
LGLQRILRQNTNRKNLLRLSRPALSESAVRNSLRNLSIAFLQETNKSTAEDTNVEEGKLHTFDFH